MRNNMEMHKGGEMMNDLGKWTDYVFGWMNFSRVPVDDLVRAGFFSVAALFTWFLMPRIFRRSQRCIDHGSAAHLLNLNSEEQTPYKESILGSIEAPIKLLFTIIAFSYLGALVAPDTIASQYLGEVWRAAIIVSLVWFLLHWKSNSFSRLLNGLTSDEKDRYLTLDKISSIVLLVLGGMAFAETCGIALQSVATIGGLGGVVTAFAAKDVLGNILSGIAIQFSKPFSIGDTISSDSVEGQVVKIGLISTQLMNSENYPTIVPNSFFSSQVVVNQSRAQWRALAIEIPVQLKDYKKTPQITAAVEGMLKFHPKVYGGKQDPRCFISQINATSVDISISCDLQSMGKEEYWSTKQDILVDAMQIVSSTGATLGAPYSSFC